MNSEYEINYELELEESINFSGTDGATFIPHVTNEGIISWTNDKEKENPNPVNIKGPQGDKGNSFTYADFTEAQKIELVQGPILEAQTSAVNAVNQAGTTQVENVTSEGTTQVNRVQSKGDEVIASIPSDYSDLVDEVSNLDRQLSDLDAMADELVAEDSSQEWQVKYVSTASSQTSGLNTVIGYIRSDSGSYPGRINPSNGYKTCWLQATEEIQVYATCNVAFRLRVSDEVPAGGNTKAFTGTVYDSGNGTMPTRTNPATVPAGKYLAFSANEKTGYTINVYQLIDTLKYVLASTVELTDAMKAEISDDIEEGLAEQTTALRNSYEKIPMTWRIGNFTITSGADIRGSLDGNTSRKSSSVIAVPYPVAVGNDLNYRLRLSLANTSYAITSTGSFSEGSFTVVPANTPFRVTIRNDGDTNISTTTDDTINEHVYFCALFPNGYAPVKWCAMGDSITQGWYSEGSQGSAVNHTDASKVWASKVAMINGWQLTNLGRGSTGWLDSVNDGDYTTSGFYVARHTNFNNYDLVTLAYGINDWKANRVVGSYKDNPVTDETPTTVMQAMRATIEAIMASNPTCKIIVILPLNCIGYSYNYGTKATNYGLGYAFSNSGTLESFVQKMIEVCNYYGIQYVDQTHYSCINRENLRTMLPDGVHPSERAHTLLALELSQKILGNSGAKNIPDAPSTDGTYSLKVSVSNGIPIYSWVTDV